MRNLIYISLLLVSFFRTEPEYTLQFHAIHHQYINDSIQPPIPQRQHQIELHLAKLPPNILGITKPIHKHLSVILINPEYRHLHNPTIMHELIHVKQFYRGELELIDNQWYWKGTLIDWSTPYAQRPWECQADHQSRQYVYKYIALRSLGALE